jgi:hypothetical protein
VNLIKLDDKTIQKIIADYEHVENRIYEEKEASIRTFYKGIRRGMRWMLKDLGVEIENVTYDPDYEENKMWKRIAESEQQ